MGRSRPRKRLSRMDAAIDAMVPLGFTEAKVKKYVSQLLRVYGGDDAWPFIEDCAYKELLEALLRDDEEDEPENETEGDHNVKDKCIEDETTAGTSSAAPDVQQDERPEENASADPTEETLPTAAQPLISELTRSSSAVSSSHPDRASSSSAVHNPPLAGDVWKDIRVNQPSGDTNSAPAFEIKNDNNVPTRRKHLPCYGWIENDEEELGEFISLKPLIGAFTVKPGKITKTVSFDLGAPKRLRRKSGWDVKPDDPD